jgi:hypothetical protein
MAGKKPLKAKTAAFAPRVPRSTPAGSGTSAFKFNPSSRAGRGAGSTAGVSSMLPSDMGTLGLKTFEEGSATTPAKPGSRLNSVDGAVSIYGTLRRADEASSVQRARVDGMFDGAPPKDQAKLNATGQANATNVNFGQAQRILDITLSAYVDLYSSLETFMEVHTKSPDDDAESFTKQTIVAEELTHLLRSWPEFHSNYLRLCTTFIKHGVGIAYFDSPRGFRFRVGGFNDFLIPRQTPASEEKISIAFARTDFQVHELFAFIKDREAAKKVGWNPDEVLRALHENVKTTGRTGMGPSALGTDYEAWQQLIKNNDIQLGLENPAVSVLHIWVKETNGTVSHFMCAEDKPKDFMYAKPGRFSKAEEAFIFFTNGVGTNGTYHSVRGLGQRIFAHIQALNKMRSAGVDAAMMGSAVMIQPLNQRGLDELEFTYYGAYAVLSPDAKIVEKAIPNMATVLQPVMNDITDQLLQNTDTMTAYGPDRGSPYRNTMQVASDLEITSRISGSSINLFYLSWERLLRETVRRILVPGAEKDSLVQRFYARCAERGVDKTFMATLDLEKTEATRSVGDGSAANRMMVQKELAAMAGQFDEVGQKNLLHDRVAALVGHKMARRYAPAPSQTNGTDRESVDTKIAMMENAAIQSGQAAMPPLSSEMHGKHLRVHIPLAQQLLTGIEEGQVDPVESLQMLVSIYQHLSDTAMMAVNNPNLEPVVAETRQVLQLLEEQVNNAMKAQAAEERRAMEAAEAAEAQAAEAAMAGPNGGGGGGGVGELMIDPATGFPVPAAPTSAAVPGQPSLPDAKAEKAMLDLELKRAHGELAMELSQRSAELDMSIRQREFEQRQALKDAEVAAKIRNTVAMREARSGGSAGGIGG